jgi:uncharacterized protein (DUF2236 family)
MSQDGYFSPDRPIWWLSREWALMLGGGRALLMQAAHPLTVAGVAEHSGYDSDPWGRLERTMEVVWSCVYGTREEADRAVARVRAVHGRVRGELREALGPFPAGTPYSAEDPELLMWVQATLIDTALLMYRAYVGSLPLAAAEGYYQDMRLLGELFGIPSGYMPRDLDALYAYKRRMLASEAITATPLAREVCWVVLRPPLPRALRPVGLALNQVSVGFLPGELRRQYGFGWDPARRAMLYASTQYVKRVVLPLLPSVIRTRSEARLAERRMADAA